MDDDDTRIRRLRLVELIGQYKTRADFVREHDLNDSYLHQLITGKAPFGEKAARNLEEKIGLPRKFLDESQPRSDRTCPGKGAAAVALKLADRAVELGNSGKLSNEKAQMVLDLLDALTDSKPSNGPEQDLDANKAA